MKYFLILTLACLLSGCTIQEFAEKAVPSHVLDHHNAQIDALLVGNKSALIEATQADVSKPDVAAQFDAILSAVPQGEEQRRDIVSFSSATATSTSDGRSRNIELITEVATEAGFMLVTTRYALDANDVCCALTNLNVKGSATSPMREATAKFMRLAKFFLIGLLAGLLLLISFLVYRRKTRQAA